MDGTTALLDHSSAATSQIGNQLTRSAIALSADQETTRSQVQKALSVGPNGKIVGLKTHVSQALWNEGIDRAIGLFEAVSAQHKTLNPLAQRFTPTDNVDKTLPAAVNNIRQSLESLTHGQMTQKSIVLKEIQRNLEPIQEFSQTVQQSLGGIDTDLKSSVQSVNELLTRYDAANRTAQQAMSRHGGEEASIDAQDQRSRIARELQAFLPIEEHPQAHGRSHLYWGGKLLVGPGGPVAHLAFESTSVFLVQDTGDRTELDIPALSQTHDQENPSGAIWGHLRARDDLFALSEQVSQIATTLRDGLNAIHNAGGCAPGRQTITGSSKISQPQNLKCDAFSNQIQIACIHKDTGELSSEGIQMFKFSNHQGDDIDAAFNQALQGITTQFTAAGQLEISSDDTDYTLAILPDPSDPAMHQGTGFSFCHFFGLNNVFASSEQSITGIPSLKVSPHLIDQPDLFASAPYLPNTENAETENQNTVLSTKSSPLQEMIHFFGKDTTFEAAGDLSGQTCSLENRAVGVSLDIAARSKSVGIRYEVHEKNLGQSRAEQATRQEEAFKKQMKDAIQCLQMQQMLQSLQSTQHMTLSRQIDLLRL